MKKLVAFLLLSCWACAGFAQSTPSARWQQHADSIFQYIDRSPVTTGILTNYGFALKDYNQFQGTALTASNQLHSLVEWRLLYTAMQTSVFNSNANLPSLATANQRIAQAQVQQQTSAAIPIASLLARYNRFSDDAGTAGLVTVSNKQLYDNPNRTRSPYEQRVLVAMCPLQTAIATRTPQFILPWQLCFTNAVTTRALEVDAGDGQGYRSIGWDQPIGAAYPADGTYTLRVRYTSTDGTVWLSQASLTVKQPPINARYGNNAVTRPTSTLFTDTRPYNGVAATGTVTVAYADGNTTGPIRKPLIVIEGYDVSHALNDKSYKFDYNALITTDIFGGINTVYKPTPGSSDRNNFNAQLSEVGQYDLIFLSYDNGTDYIQRNAYLVERLIQWVNENKQPLNGVNQPNVVLGMSMGGLVARYALRDMEVRRATSPSLPAHDTRLYISHEAPHQGANVPLGFQYMVKSVAAISLFPGITLGDENPDLKKFASLLNEPATQQLLIYQTDPNSDAVHRAWLAEYNQLGYPQQCRNVATSGGSECGRPQAFAPGANLLNIQGTGLLDDTYSRLINGANFFLGAGTGLVTGGILSLFAGTGVGAIAIAVGYGVGAILALGNYEGHVDFVVNALPNQQQLPIYHGRLSIYKDVVFGLFTTHFLNYADDNNSSPNMLPYDSAPGGIYDINQLSKGALSQISSAIPIAGTRSYVQPTFCFVPTTSALDIGGGNVTLGSQDLTASYVNTAPPAAPSNTPFANFITAGRENLTHILWNGLNSKWAFQEMQSAPQNTDCQSFCQANPTIYVPGAICGSGTTFSINNLPTGTQVAWSLSTSAAVSAKQGSGPSFTVGFGGGNSGGGTLTATLTSDCGLLTISTPVYAGPPATPLFSGPTELDCSTYAQTYYITNYSRALTYTTRAGGVVNVKPVLPNVGSF